MTLRNAFEEIGLESTLRKILAAVTWARGPQDQMRVVVDSGNITTSGITSVFNSNANSSMNSSGQAYWVQNTWNAMDVRETARESSEQHFMMTRNRWNIT